MDALRELLERNELKADDFDLDGNAALARLQQESHTRQDALQHIEQHANKGSHHNQVLLSLLRLALGDAITPSEFEALVKAAPFRLVPSLLARWLRAQPSGTDLFSAVVLQQQILTHELVLAASREAIRRSETDAQQLYQNAGQALDVLCSECVSVAKQDLIVPTVFAISQRALDQSDLLLVKRCWHLLLRFPPGSCGSESASIISYLWAQTQQLLNASSSGWARQLKLSLFFASHLATFCLVCVDVDLLPSVESLLAFICNSCRNTRIVDSSVRKLFAHVEKVLRRRLQPECCFTMLDTLDRSSVDGAIIVACLCRVGASAHVPASTLLEALLACTSGTRYRLLLSRSLFQDCISSVHQLCISSAGDEEVWRLLLSALFSTDMALARLGQEGVCALVCSASVAAAIDATRFLLEQASASLSSSPHCLTAEQQRWAWLLSRLIGNGGADLQRCVLQDALLPSLNATASASVLHPMHALLLSQICYKRLHADVQHEFLPRLLRFCHRAFQQRLHHQQEQSQEDQAIGTALYALSGLLRSFTDPRPVLASEGPHLLSALMNLLLSSKLQHSAKLHSSAIDVCSSLLIALNMQQLVLLLQKLADMYEELPLARSALVDLLQSASHQPRLHATLEPLLVVALRHSLPNREAIVLVNVLERLQLTPENRAHLQRLRQQLLQQEEERQKNSALDEVCRDADRLIVSLTMCEREVLEDAHERLYSRLHEIEQLLHVKKDT